MSTATFLKSDTTTQGAWYHGSTTVYGADGYNVIGYSKTGVTNPNYPSYAVVTSSNTTVYTYVLSSSDVRALEYPPPGTSDGSDSNRIAAVWYSQLPSMSIDIQDGNLHQIAIYALDWDDSGRVQQIQITDDNNGNVVLDTRSISSFVDGIWLVWTVSGKVTFTLTHSAGPNAVVSGLFFDPAPAMPAVFPPLVSRPRFEPALYE